MAIGEKRLDDFYQKTIPSQKHALPEHAHAGISEINKNGENQEGKEMIELIAYPGKIGKARRIRQDSQDENENQRRVEKYLLRGHGILNEKKQSPDSPLNCVPPGADDRGSSAPEEWCSFFKKA